MKRLMVCRNLVVLGALVAACGGSDSDGAGSSSKVLVSGTASAPDPTCPAGGTKLTFGADSNGNGQLDPDEVTGTQVVCNPGQAPTLTSVTATGPDDKCKNGGTLVKSGADTNFNGKLDDGEVTQTTEICGGGTSTELSKTTPIAAGDATCPFGGTKTSSGLDNGANGSVAGDGVLQDGEIQNTAVTCKNGNQFPGTYVPPTGAAGTNKLLVSGGAGSAGSGGIAGPIILSLDQGTLGGNLAVFKTGAADASFTAATVTPKLGTTALDVTANKTISTHANSGEAADGEYYVIGNGLFYRQDAGNPQVTVTGIHVAATATLTFDPSAFVTSLVNDVHNEGTITSSLTNGTRGTVVFVMGGRFIGAAGSKLALAGATVPGAAGGNGGMFAVIANQIYNAGAIDTSGANGDPGGAFAGGAAGQVILGASNGVDAGPLENTGDIKATGGSGKGTDAVGGFGGNVQLSSGSRGTRVKGAIDLSGGGGGGGGNVGGSIQVGTFGGDIRLSGSINQKGGDVDEAKCSATCAGGPGGALGLSANGGGVRLAADAVATGGKSKGTVGGAGGNLIVITADSNDPVLGTPLAAGSIHVSGNMDRRGGAGASGGSGGGGAQIHVSTNRPNGQELLLFGYDTLDASGGSGTTGGGNASIISLSNNPSPGNVPSGSVITDANLVAKGGVASASGSGANGGVAALVSSNNGVNATSSQAVRVGGSVDVSGGDGVASGGSGGTIQLRARERVDAFGTITSLGGNASGAAGSGAVGGSITLVAGTAATSAAAIRMKGGNGTGATSTGGGCSGISIVSGAFSAAGAITCAGGSGTGAAGGNGGPISIASSLSSSVLTTVSAAGGTGTPNGTPGTVLIDGMTQ